MKRLFVSCVALGALVLQAGVALAQSSIDALRQDLDAAKQQHEDATTQSLSNFFTQVNQAMAGPDAAAALWQAAGGTMPAPMPRVTEHDTESASEREARLEQDKANATTAGNLLQLHCGLLHYAALFVAEPDRKGLQDDFNAWLQKAAQTYPHLGTIVPPPTLLPGDRRHIDHSHDPEKEDKEDKEDRDQPPLQPPPPPPPPFKFEEVKAKAMRDSIIAKYLGSVSWGDKDPGGWAVRDIPRLYKANILDPLRAAPTQATLDAWDVYIAMENADEPDTDKWTSTDYPPLQFERSYDDCLISPSTEKIEALVQIIHANPTHPDADDWITRTKQLLDDYSAKHGGPPAPSASAANTPPPPAAATNSNITVTTVQQGDAQVITTHTNAAPNPAPPQ